MAMGPAPISSVTSALDVAPAVALSVSTRAADSPAKPKRPLTFWQNPLVQNILPLGTSITFHAALIVIALLIGDAINRGTRLVVQEQLTIPDASFTDGPVGGIPNPGLGGDPNRAAAQDQFSDIAMSSEGWAEKPSQTLTQSLMGGGAGDSATEMSVIGLGASTGAGDGNGVARGSALGTGAGDGGGELAAFGVPGGGSGVGPRFMGQGTGGNTRSIAFVCDASGSMMSKMVPLKNELKRTIDQLRPIQSFSVIFFADAKPQALSQQLLFANPANKRKANDFLQGVATAGQTDPLPAMELAFKQRPQLIFLLTDGDFPDNRAVLQRIRELHNTYSNVRINTIAFVGDTDNDKEFINVLSTIAKENGGVFKKISQDEVQ